LQADSDGTVQCRAWLRAAHFTIERSVNRLDALLLQYAASLSSTVREAASSESYAIALPIESSLRPMLDGAVLDQVESDWWQQRLFEALGNARSR